MLDSYISVRPGDVNVTVESKRAPTDESVRLLREMEAKAQEQVLKAIRLDSNTFKGVMHKMYNSLTDEHVYRIIFDLNGEQTDVLCRKQRDMPMTEFVQDVADTIAQSIASHIVWDLSKDIKEW